MAELGSDVLRDRRLLVIEDDYLLASDLAEALAAHGAEVIGPAASVEGALALLATNGKIDAAVLDINLCGERVYPVATVPRCQSRWTRACSCACCGRVDDTNGVRRSAHALQPMRHERTDHHRRSYARSSLAVGLLPRVRTRARRRPRDPATAQ
jgi:CheY-like chemotaxis protein